MLILILQQKKYIIEGGQYIIEGGQYIIEGGQYLPLLYDLECYKSVFRIRLDLETDPCKNN